MLAIPLRSRRMACVSCDGHLLRSFMSAVCDAGSSGLPFLSLQRAHRNNGQIAHSSTRHVQSKSPWQTRDRVIHAQREPQRRSMSKTVASQAATQRGHNGILDDDDIADLMFETSNSRASLKKASRKQDLVQPKMETESGDANSLSQDNSAIADPATAEYVPWYLQDSASDEVQPIAAGQDLPEMPVHSPELLEPIVKHTLETLGISHLEILDLREMTDPPPALGANLIMVIGTARSERHLHASADKLCRWLRTEYKMTPFADGLLGRNEMKIAVRRRVRRAKMMSAVGAKTADDGDIADGLRSGWICVNVGRITGGVLPEHATAVREIVGFGTMSTSTTLVVQMMTEEKREEMALEDLWWKALRAQKRRKAELLQKAGEQPADETDNTDLKHSSVETGQDETKYRPIHAHS